MPERDPNPARCIGAMTETHRPPALEWPVGGGELFLAALTIGSAPHAERIEGPLARAAERGVRVQDRYAACALRRARAH